MATVQDKLAEFADAATGGGRKVWLYFGSHAQLVRDVALDGTYSGVVFAKTVDEEDLLVDVSTLVAVKAE